eukprot:3030396-Alexandrium_andersonii.AAC.1
MAGWLWPEPRPVCHRPSSAGEFPGESQAAPSWLRWGSDGVPKGVLRGFTRGLRGASRRGS